MCILCAVQRWSRRAAAMLPWLLVPLVALWALSQLLLPPRLRFEATSPRLACVLVLLATLFWYEVLVPNLSLWRSRRSARLLELRLSRAAELARLRRAATRRCRNCRAPYRDQTPPSGRFMCSSCGHLSKRPVLDLPQSPHPSTPGFLASWLCLQDSPNCLGPLRVSPCLTWLWRKSSREGDPCDGKGLSGLSASRKGADGGESKAERAKRKAEEKRIARLEKEMLEEEERKQREDVARLVEEQRKLRDEVLEAEKDSLRRMAAVGKRDPRKGTEKRRKDKDKDSSKSSSDVEDIEKRDGRECEGKREFDKGGENEKLAPNRAVGGGGGGGGESYRSHISARVKGSFLSSSRGFSGASFFSRSAQGSAACATTRASKHANGLPDHGQTFGRRKDAQLFGHGVGMVASNGDDRKASTNFHRPVDSNVQSVPTALKKSWRQLFTRSSAVSPCPDPDTTDSLKYSNPLDARGLRISDGEVIPNFHNHINLGQPLPFNGYPSLNYSLDSSVSRLEDNYMPPLMKHSLKDSVLDEADIFEDPCFVPDPVSLLGPVSESLDNFSLDVGTRFSVNCKMDEPRPVKNQPFLADVSKPSPIESPISRQRVSELPQKVSRDVNGSNLDYSKNEHGTWQMWGTPLAQDGLGLLGGSNWIQNLAQNKQIQGEAMHLPHNSMVSHTQTENHALPGIHTPQNVRIKNYQNGGIFSPPYPVPDSDLSVQSSLFQPLPFHDDHRYVRFNQYEDHRSLFQSWPRDAPNSPASSNHSELSPANCWSNSDYHETMGGSPFDRTLTGSPFASDADVQPVWPFN